MRHRIPIPPTLECNKGIRISPAATWIFKVPVPNLSSFAERTRAFGSLLVKVKVISKPFAGAGSANKINEGT